MKYLLDTNAYLDADVEDFIRPLERTGRLVTPTFDDWVEASALVTAIERRDREGLPPVEDVGAEAREVHDQVGWGESSLE